MEDRLCQKCCQKWTFLFFREALPLIITVLMFLFRFILHEFRSRIHRRPFFPHIVATKFSLLKHLQTPNSRLLCYIFKGLRGFFQCVILSPIYWVFIVFDWVHICKKPFLKCKIKTCLNPSNLVFTPVHLQLVKNCW